MRKDALQELIIKHTSGLSYALKFKKEEELTILLKEFSDDLTKKEVEDNEDISINEFIQFLDKKKQIADDKIQEFFSASFLKKENSDAAKILRKFIAAEKAKSYGETLSKLTEENDPFPIGELPEELVQLVFELTDPITRVKWSQTSSTYFKAAKDRRYWQDAMGQLIAAGCSASVVRELTGYLKGSDYERLYQAYRGLCYSGRFLEKYSLYDLPIDRHSAQLVILLILSGNTNALLRALNILGNSKQFSTLSPYVYDVFTRFIRDLVLLSGCSMDFAQKHANFQCGLKEFQLVYFDESFPTRDDDIIIPWCLAVSSNNKSAIRLINNLSSKYTWSRTIFPLLTSTEPVTEKEIDKGKDYFDDDLGFIARSKNRELFKNLITALVKSDNVVLLQRVLEFCIKIGFGKTSAFHADDFKYVKSLAMAKYIFEFIKEHNIRIHRAYLIYWTYPELFSRMFAYTKTLPKNENPFNSVSYIDQVIGFFKQNECNLPHTILSATVASGSMPAIEHVIALCERGDLYLLGQAKYTLPQALTTNDNNILHLAVLDGDIPAVVFLLGKCAELSINPKDIPFYLNIFQIAKLDQDAAMIIAIREACNRLNINFTPDTPNVNGKTAIELPKCDVQAVNDALTKPLDELLSAQLTKSGPGTR